MKSGITSNMDSINIENLISKIEAVNIEYENRIEGDAIMLTNTYK